MIERRVNLIKRSTDRLLELMKLPKDKLWWQVFQRETRLHLRRSLALFWTAHFGRRPPKHGS